SPLSPILFILYIASLYQAICQASPAVSLIGFADDTNLLAFGRAKEASTEGLEGLPSVGKDLGGRKQWSRPLELLWPGGGTTTIALSKLARFLRVWLD
ncbi:hypothetical protein MYCTH_38236, partial [Thermothelomyces thermophilus ATCC 42464]